MGRIKRYNYDKEKGVAEVVIYDTKRKVRGRGKAFVHKEDLDFASEFTGLTIAEARAESDFYKKRESIKMKEAARLRAMADAIEESAKVDGDRSRGSLDYSKYYIEQKDKLYRKVEENREREDGLENIEFVDLGDLTEGLSEEEKERIEKEIQKGMVKND